MLRQDQALDPHEGQGPGGSHLLEIDPHRVVVDDLDALHSAVRRTGCRPRVGILDEVVGEADIFRGEGLAVRPADILLQLPGDRLAIGRHAAVFDGRDLGGQERHEAAVGVIAGQRLIGDTRGSPIGRTRGQVRIESFRGLPEQDPQRIACATSLGPRRFNRRRGRGLGRNTRRRPRTCDEQPCQDAQQSQDADPTQSVIFS